VSDTDQQPRILVIVPAWNEQACISDTVREIRERVSGADVLVVDDGSGDLTAAMAREAGARVLRLPFNLGVGGAMRAGYRWAHAEGYDVAVQIDADGQHDPSFLAPVVSALDGHDIVIGARFARPDDPYLARGPRRWAMYLLAAVLTRLAHTRLTDVTSGFRACNRRAMLIFAQHYPAEYLGDTVESLVIALRMGCRITQVPVTMRPRAGGVPSASPAKAALFLGRAVVALCMALVRTWPATFDNGAPDALAPGLGGRR
jgi:glycosyltransferase involved in cell wall biosynthesis